MTRRSFFHSFSASLLALPAVARAAEGASGGQHYLPVTERTGQAHVVADELAKAGIAVKELPGQKLVAVCVEERCGTVKEFRREVRNLYVMIGPMAKALGMKAEFTADRRQVSFSLDPRNEPPLQLPVRPGQLAPDFRVTGLDGKSIALSGFRGQRVMINNWATWCGSRNDLPIWQRMHTRFQGNQFEVFSIAADVQGPSLVRSYAQKYKVTFPLAVDQADVVGRIFGLKNTPVSVFIDEVGIVRFTAAGPVPEMIQRVMELFKEPLLDLRGSPPQLTEALTREDLVRRVAEVPADWRARSSLALALDAAGKPAEALAQAEEAVRLQPRNAGVLYICGLVLWNQRQAQMALIKWKQARDLEPDNWRIRRNIWAIEYPEKFYKHRQPDMEWQKDQLAKELGGKGETTP